VSLRGSNNLDMTTIFAANPNQADSSRPIIPHYVSDKIGNMFGVQLLCQASLLRSNQSFFC
jgi:hypothetical protein